MRTNKHEERLAKEKIHKAEQGKECMHELPGMSFLINPQRNPRDGWDTNGELIHSVLVNESYSTIASHIDQSLRNKIMRGEYVDFARLMPRDRLEDHETADGDGE